MSSDSPHRYLISQPKQPFFFYISHPNIEEKIAVWAARLISYYYYHYTILYMSKVQFCMLRWLKAEQDSEVKQGEPSEIYC